MNEPDGSGGQSDLAQHGFFGTNYFGFFLNGKVDSFCPPSLQHLVTLFVERNHALWRSPQVVKWLKQVKEIRFILLIFQNASIVVKKVYAKDPMVENCTAVIKLEYGENPQNIFNFLLLSGKDNLTH